MHFGLLRDSCTAGVAGAAMKTLRRVLSMAAHAVAFERAIVTGAGSGIDPGWWVVADGGCFTCAMLLRFRLLAAARFPILNPAFLSSCASPSFFSRALSAPFLRV